MIINALIELASGNSVQSRQINLKSHQSIVNNQKNIESWTLEFGVLTVDSNLYAAALYFTSTVVQIDLRIAESDSK
ncbi:hypothetical protein PCC6912_53330 [Chlorogloeopsis fritschii PCC 6912]|uniref:Uncharacterized protein n=1 Tax=Chlorogloeopsis fritschii PCC 6912 TaxID=211165 RepID=A0A433N060_CHLFR|nr:hypothetical protein PCC6912_53330 [Chlorogloeopsis fritschii PCC 6912]